MINTMLIMIILEVFMTRNKIVPEGLQYGYKRIAFTLAEVLITLGIIGVVAAMTIPTLMKNYQKKVLEVQFKKSVAVVQQIILKARQELDTEYLATYCASYSAEKLYYNKNSCYNAIYNQMNLIQPANKWERLSGIRYSVNRDDGSVKNFTGETSIGNIDSSFSGILYTNPLKDGSFISAQVANRYLWFIVDTNGYSKPNKLGQDIFVFVVNKNRDTLYGFQPSNVNVSDEDVEAMYPEGTSSRNFAIAVYGNPCNLTSARQGNGRGCTYYALQNKCPWDSTKTFWECLP